MDFCFHDKPPSSCVTFFFRHRAIPMKKIKVTSANGAYEVICGRGAVAKSAEAVTALSPNAAIYLISSPRVWKHCGAPLEKIFSGVSRATILFNDREAAKLDSNAGSSRDGGNVRISGQTRDRIERPSQLPSSVTP